MAATQAPPRPSGSASSAGSQASSNRNAQRNADMLADMLASSQAARMQRGAHRSEYARIENAGALGAATPQNAAVSPDDDHLYVVPKLGKENGAFAEAQRLQNVQPLRPGQRVQFPGQYEIVTGATLQARRNALGPLTKEWSDYSRARPGVEAQVDAEITNRYGDRIAHAQQMKRDIELYTSPGASRDRIKSDYKSAFKKFLTRIVLPVVLIAVCPPLGAAAAAVSWPLGIAAVIKTAAIATKPLRAEANRQHKFAEDGKAADRTLRQVAEAKNRRMEERIDGRYRMRSRGLAKQAERSMRGDPAMQAQAFLNSKSGADLYGDYLQTVQDKMNRTKQQVAKENKTFLNGLLAGAVKVDARGVPQVDAKTGAPLPLSKADREAVAESLLIMNDPKAVLKIVRRDGEVRLPNNMGGSVKLSPAGQDFVMQAENDLSNGVSAGAGRSRYNSAGFGGSSGPSGGSAGFGSTGPSTPSGPGGGPHSGPSPSGSTIPGQASWGPANNGPGAGPVQNISSAPSRGGGGMSL